MKEKKGFTLIELLAIIVILGFIMTIGIPAISNMIRDSKYKTYLDSARTYVNVVRNEVVNRNYVFNSKNTTYYVAIENIEVDKEGSSPFGSWEDAYVVVVYDGKEYSYYWTSVDSAGYKVFLKLIDDLTIGDIGHDTNLTVDTNVGVGSREKIHLIDKSGNIIDKAASVGP